MRSAHAAQQVWDGRERSYQRQSPRLLRRHVDQPESVRKVKEVETTSDIFAFLATEPNTEVGAIHPKAICR
jgi:hypothetical protein